MNGPTREELAAQWGENQQLMDQWLDIHLPINPREPLNPLRLEVLTWFHREFNPRSIYAGVATPTNSTGAAVPTQGGPGNASTNTPDVNQHTFRQQVEQLMREKAEEGMALIALDSASDVTTVDSAGENRTVRQSNGRLQEALQALRQSDFCKELLGRDPPMPEEQLDALLMVMRSEFPEEMRRVRQLQEDRSRAGGTDPAGANQQGDVGDNDLAAGSSSRGN